MKKYKQVSTAAKALSTIEQLFQLAEDNGTPAEVQIKIVRTVCGGILGHDRFLAEIEGSKYVATE